MERHSDYQQARLAVDPDASVLRVARSLIGAAALGAFCLDMSLQEMLPPVTTRHVA